MSTDNPFAAPVADIGPGKERLALEASEKSMLRLSSWMLFAAALVIPLGLFLAYGGIERRSPFGLDGWAAVAAILVVGAGELFVGLRLRALRPGMRAPAVLACLPLMIAFPIGTWVAIRGIAALLTRGAGQVLAPGYPRTVDPKRYPIVVPLLLGPFLLAAVVAGFVLMMVPPNLR